MKKKEENHEEIDLKIDSDIETIKEEKETRLKLSSESYDDEPNNQNMKHGHSSENRKSYFIRGYYRRKKEITI